MRHSGESGQCKTHVNMRSCGQTLHDGLFTCMKVHLLRQHMTSVSSQVDGWTPPREGYPTMHARADGAGAGEHAWYLRADLTRFVRYRQILLT